MHKKQNKQDQAAEPAHPDPVEDECLNADADCVCEEFNLDGDYQLPSGNDINAVRDMKLSALVAAKWGQLARDALAFVDFFQIWNDEQLDIVGGSFGAGVALPTVALEILAGAAATAVFGPISTLYGANEEADEEDGDVTMDVAPDHEDVVVEEAEPHPQPAPKKSKK